VRKPVNLEKLKFFLGKLWPMYILYRSLCKKNFNSAVNYLRQGYFRESIFSFLFFRPL